MQFDCTWMFAPALIMITNPWKKTRLFFSRLMDK